MRMVLPAGLSFRRLMHGGAVWWWIGAMVVPGLWLSGGGWSEGANERWFRLFGLSREGIFAGRIWEIGSYAFLHGGWFHLGLNAVFLWAVGLRIQHSTSGNLLSLALMGGIAAGGVFHLLFQPGLLVGISGGCTALLLLLCQLSPDSRMIPLGISAKNIGRGVLTAEGLLTLLHPESGVAGFSSAGKWIVAQGFSSLFQLGHACHFGGGLAGWAIGRWLLRQRISLATLRAQRARRELSDQKRRPD